MSHSRDQDWEEMCILKSFAFTPEFAKLMLKDLPVALDRGPNPPDFVVTYPSDRTSIEITIFTTPQIEIYRRERQGEGAYTSTLRKGKPNASFWQGIRKGTLPDDSLCMPHFEAEIDIERDYMTVATTILKQKTEGLAAYYTDYSTRLLLIHDRLSEFPSKFSERMPRLRSWIEQNPQAYSFDGIFVVDGSHNSSVASYKIG